MHDVARLHRLHDDPVVGVDGTARRIALWVLCLCALTTAIDITITNVALPSIGDELQAPTSELQWVVDAYNIVLSGAARARRWARRPVRAQAGVPLRVRPPACRS